MNDLLIQTESDLLWLSLNRPQAHNAYSKAMVRGLIQALEQAEADDSIKVVIIKGEGKSFCAGGDVKSMREQSDLFAGDALELKHNYQRYIQKLTQVLFHYPKPVIAMIQGAAIGAGLDLTTLCDLRIASSKASFAESFVKLGLIAGDGGSLLLPRIVGFAKAMEMSLTGKKYNAEEALSMGLVNFVTGPENLEEVTRNHAQKIAVYPPQAVSLMKKALVQGQRESLEAHLERGAAYQALLQRDPVHFDLLNKK